MDVHFLYGEKIKIFYRNREKPGGLNKSIEACKQQIAYASKAAKAFKKEFNGSLPSHKGYEQLAIIFEKQKEYQSAIEICKQAESQGWSGEWKKRIQRCEKKADKLAKTKVIKEPKTKAVIERAIKDTNAKGISIKKASSKQTVPAAAADTIYTIIKRSKKGVDTATIMEQTGYNQKKISNLLYKLKKKGQIKSTDRGVYVEA